MKKIDLDGALLWLGFGRGVCVVGSGDFAAVSWVSCRSDGPCRSAGWLSE